MNLRNINILNYLQKETTIEYNNLKSNKNYVNFSYVNEYFQKYNSFYWIELIKKSNDKEDVENFIGTINSDLNFLIFNKLEYIQKFVKLFNENDTKQELINYIILTKTKRQKIDVNEIFKITKTEGHSNNYISLYQKLINILPEIYSFDSIYIPTERSFLHLIAENTLGLINNNVRIPKHLLESGQDYEKAIQTIKELPLNIIDKKLKYKREGKSSYIYHNENQKVDLLESSSGLQSIIPVLLLVEYAKSLKDKYNFNFVVEEPELNIYPKAQHELIKYLVKNCLFDRKNLILTTHSPFVLASINNLLLAYDKGQSNPKEVTKIIKKESWLNPKNFIAYELKNGKARLIMDDKLGQIKTNMIDTISDDFSNEFDKLLDL